MRPIVGIICEYDPFHRGHSKQFALVRERLPNAAIVCLMSGCFTQRGAPALFPPHFRALRALEAGADAVLELPCMVAVRDAENFALGGVRLLSQLGGVTHLSFGCEDADAPLSEAAALLEEPTDRFHDSLRAALNEGKPFAYAQGRALEAVLGEHAAALAKPNNTLAVCYLRALRRLQSGLIPLPVVREGAYHAQALDSGDAPSASAVRAAYLAGDHTRAEVACGYAFGDTPACRPNALDQALLYRLRAMTAKELRAIPDCTEGLENRVMKAAREATDREQLLALLKTRRYPYTRLSRLATHALLGLTATEAAREPQACRLLGFRRESEALPGVLSQGSVTLTASGLALPPLDRRAYELWALGAGLPAGWMLRQPIVVCESARFDVQ